jgi:hypothetical protein
MQMGLARLLMAQVLKRKAVEKVALLLKPGALVVLF